MKWISVSDKKPDISVYVLIIDQYNEIDIGFIQRNERRYQKNYKKVVEEYFTWEYYRGCCFPQRPEPTYWCALENIPLPKVDNETAM